MHGVDFSIGAGEKLALVGESGSGKTVTALSLLRLVHNARITGRADFAGRDLLGLPERELLGVRGREIAMIFQEPMTALNPLYTVGNQIAEVLQLKQGAVAARSASSGHSVVGGHRNPRARAARRCLPAPVVGRPEAARHDRDGPGLPAQAAAGR